MSCVPMQIAAAVIIVVMQHLGSIGRLNHSFLSKGATLRRPMLPITDVTGSHTRSSAFYGLGSGSFINRRGRAFRPVVSIESRSSEGRPLGGPPLSGPPAINSSIQSNRPGSIGRPADFNEALDSGGTNRPFR